MRVHYLQQMPVDSVACVNRDTGTILVNEPLFRQYTSFEQQFILLHEEGHYRLNTQSELDADAYAFDRLVGTQPHSLLQLCEALEHTLPFSSQEHYERVRVQLIRALTWDARHGNRKAEKALNQLVGGFSGDAAIPGTRRHGKPLNSRILQICLLSILIFVSYKLFVK
jgi:hypothetical protein